MRTTIDLPDAIFRRVRALAAARKATLRSLVIEGLQGLLERPRSGKFKLRDGGFPGKPGFASGGGVENIAETIRQVNEGRSLP